MKQYRMTDEEFAELLKAGKPTPLMYLPGGQPMFDSPQENANRFWQKLATKYGFQWDSVRPASTNDLHDFVAHSTVAEEF